jgi:hypothetical protein
MRKKYKGGLLKDIIEKGNMTFILIVPILFIFTISFLNGQITKEYMIAILSILKNIWIYIGSSGGIISLCIIIYKYLKRPKLKINKFNRDRDLIIMKDEDRSDMRRNIFRLKIQNEKKQKAENCIGILEVINKNNERYYEDHYCLHWADLKPTQTFSSPEPISIFEVAPRFIDIIFTEQFTEYEGAWIATPPALRHSDIDDQFYLPPGEYEIRVKVDCVNGKRDEKEYKILVSKNWKEVQVKEINN